MKPFDYLHVLEPDYIANCAGIELADVRRPYGDDMGVRYTYAGTAGHAVQELVWFEQNLLLLFGSISPFEGSSQHQIISKGDWIHVQFQIAGDGEEMIGTGQPIATGAQSCTISRYPCGSLVHRQTRSAPHWRAVCLYFRPDLLAHAFPATQTDACTPWSWLADSRPSEANSVEFPLTPLELVAINDIFACSFQGPLRRSYMNAKAIELFTLAMAHLGESAASELQLLTKADQQRITKVRDILMVEIDKQLTLGQLAARVGVNRSKLATGFKLIFGTSVQAYWRELRLYRAREMLEIERLPVTDVAAAVGYADIACLTRAFEKRFGVSPKECRRRRAEQMN
jgi:AraC family transcriptional regulator, transcriptional activator of the genes for pyochelin and ferripyochelin receptors